jgi:hypothetical protein
MNTPGNRIERVGGGCGVNGCLYAAVALFALLLVGMLVVAVVRFSSPPEPRLGPQPAQPMGVAVPLEAPAVAGALPG